MTKNTRFDDGLNIRREVVGAEYVERAYDKAGAFGRDFQDIVTEYCWGASWGRQALSRRDRSLLNIVILGTLGRNTELGLHLRGALRNGVTVDEIRDALIHLSIYSGIPAGVESFRIAQEVLEDWDKTQAETKQEKDQQA